MSDTNKEIFSRVYLLYLIIVLLAIVIIGRALYIQIIEGSKWREKAEKINLRYRNIDATRGNICAYDGSLLATSVPIFDLRMDASSSIIPDNVFYSRIDSLSICLSNLFKDRSSVSYRKEIVQARKSGNRYYLLKRNVSYAQLKQIKSFPIFNFGRYRGGLIVMGKNKREYPFKELAYRTIGWDKKGKKNDVGLEASFSDQLQGTRGKQLMQKIGHNAWRPIDDAFAIEPQDGKDIITTIDVQLQDVAENALMKQLIKHNADHGCAVVMEVKTGAIKAIANLGRTNNGTYHEIYNYAVGESAEPGSTFKLASMIIALEDGKIELEDSIATGEGVYSFYDRKMRDSHKNGFGTITVRHAFEISSNIGISKLIHDAYKETPEKYSKGLFDLGLDKPLGLEIAGEGIPFVKAPTHKLWSLTSLPWMSIGYEVQLTPLQILNLYNTVANKGKAMKPYLVSEIIQSGKPIRQFSPTVLNPSICSSSTIEKMNSLLKGVVTNGTGQNLKSTVYAIAGKTGTAQIADNNKGYNKTNYKASFAGYFPADTPQYSCIVVINNPKSGVYYGNSLAGPVFREIADKVYAVSANMQEKEGLHTFSPQKIRLSRVCKKDEISKIANFLDIPFKENNIHSEWAQTSGDSGKIILQPKLFKNNIIPDLRGMSCKDAIYLLESMQLKVSFSGKGRVVSQSVRAGTRATKGRIINLRLNI